MCVSNLTSIYNLMYFYFRQKKQNPLTFIFQKIILANKNDQLKNF